MNKLQKIVAIPAITAVLLGGGAIGAYASLASAQTGETGAATSAKAGKMRGEKPGVHGTVTAVNGTTITVKGENDTSYTVDTSAATFKKFTAGAEPTTASIAEIAVGDEIGVRGTVSGTTIAATEVIEGMPMRGLGRGDMGAHGKGPGVMGEVTAVNGSTITVKGPNGTSYTVNAGSATVQKMVAGSLTDIAVGDHIGVQGTVSGTSVTATSIMDGLPSRPAINQ